MCHFESDLKTFSNEETAKASLAILHNFTSDNNYVLFVVLRLKVPGEFFKIFSIRRF